MFLTFKKHYYFNYSFSACIWALLYLLHSFTPCAADITTGLVAYYPFNGNANDESSTGNHGTANGAVLTTDRFNQADSAYSFDGLNDYIQAAHHAALNVSNSTVSAWIKSNDMTKLNQDIISKTQSGGYGLSINDDGAGPNIFGLALHISGSYRYVLSNEHLDSNRWYHVCGTFDGTTARFYVDGYLEGEESFSGTVTNNTSPLVIGNESVQLYDPFDGKIDDVRIYNRTLTETEVKELYDSESGLVAYYPFNSNANDESGSGNDGTANGAVLTDDRFGSVDSAYFFDGSDDYISVPNSSSLELLNDMTITAWINTSSTSSAFQIIARKGAPAAGTGSTSYAFYIRSNNELAFYFTGGTVHETANLDLIADVWYHVAVSFNNASNLVRLFVNGQRVYNVSEANSPVEYDYPFGIGRTNDPGQFFGGVIDEVRIYNRALSETEVKKLYDFESGLVAYYPFNGNAYDESGQGNHGTVNGATLTTDRFGEPDSAYLFDGSNDYIDSGNDTSIRINGPFTMAAWIEVNTFSDKNQGIIAKWSGVSPVNQRAYALILENQMVAANSVCVNTLGMGISSNGECTHGGSSVCNIVAADTVIPNPTWYHIVGVYEPGTAITLYLNGQQNVIYTDTIVASIHDAATNLIIGSQYDLGSSNYFFDGKIDDVRIYHRALSASEIQQLVADSTCQLQISPQTPTVEPGQSFEFSAANNMSNPVSVTWTLTQNNSGSATTGGSGTTFAYVAGSTEGTTDVLEATDGGGCLATTVTITINDPPGIVTHLIIAPGDEQNTLSWTNPSDADLAGILVLRKEGSYPDSPTDPTATVVFDASGTTVTDLSLTNGTTYYYSLYAYDSEPNYGAVVQRTGTPEAGVVDSEAPIINTGPFVEVIAPNAAVISWTTNESATSIIEYGPTDTYGDIITNDDYTTDHLILVDSLISSTLYHFKVGSDDPAGNGPTYSLDHTFTTPSAPDATAPQITAGPIVVNQTSSSGQVIWNSDDAARSELRYGTTSSYGFLVADPGYTSNHSTPLSGLNADTTYHYQITLYNVDGGTSVSGDYTFETLESDNTNAPVITGGPTCDTYAATPDTLWIRWSTDEISNSRVDFGMVSATYTDSSYDTTLVTEHVAVLTQLQPDQTYYYRVGSTDPEGNGPSYSSECSCTTLPAGTDTDPVILWGPEVDQHSVTQTSAVIMWQTDQPCISRIDYGETAGYGESRTNNRYARKHSMTITDLLPGTEYHYQVTSTSMDADSVASVDDVFWTNSDSNQSDPYFVSGPTVAYSGHNGGGEQSTVIVGETFVPSGHKVEIWMDGGKTSVPVKTLLDMELRIHHFIVITGLQAGESYLYQIETTDAYGNTAQTSVTKASRGFTVTLDTTDPVITVGPSTLYASDTKAIIAWTTDEVSDSRIELGSTPGLYTLSYEQPEYVDSHQILLSNLDQLGVTTIYYRVGSTDPVGNGRTWATGTIVLGSADLTGPVISNIDIQTSDITTRTISWDTDEMADSRVVFGDSGAYGHSIMDSNWKSAHELTLSNLDPDRTYYYRIRSKDPAGNWSQSDEYSFYVDYVPELSPLAFFLLITVLSLVILRFKSRCPGHN
ncbi:LamG-like jellyroll fold domain-containing protein [candidate division CSSED10-310 bacterium]|uniref:LamG-like jellyroll fold domain-containing protein n=1 Tax=candidate division CSSED10-310 bacterium TaxID=2855610 RepID=A0ABV6YQZ2_UNCC1